MNISEACRTIRRCNDLFYDRRPPGIEPAGVVEAVAVLKNYLEQVKADGRPIDDLSISASLLFTPQAMSWVMQFVTSAETIEATRKRAPSH